MNAAGVIQVEAILNLVVQAFYPKAFPILQEVEMLAGILTGANPPTGPTMGGVITNSSGARYGLYAVPMGAPGTSVTITF